MVPVLMPNNVPATLCPLYPSWSMLLEPANNNGSSSGTANAFCLTVLPLPCMQVAAKCSSADDRDYYSFAIDGATSSTVLVTVAYSPTLLILYPYNETTRR
jgi:hypothetical protein